MKPASNDPCPCGRTAPGGRPLTFSGCCGRYVTGAEPAPDAKALMRSRYTAFVMEDAHYLLATWHAGTRPLSVTFEPGLKWLGLEVREHRVVDATHAEVEFVARSRAAGRGHRLHERSRFVCEDGRWFYIDGVIR